MEGTLTFCPRCGQKRPDPHDYSLGHFFHDAFHELFHVDGKIGRTFQTMLRTPGQITKDYWEGRRGRYLTPFRIYLLATAAFFVFGRIIAPEANPQTLPAGISPTLFEARFQLLYKGLLVLSNGGLALLFHLLLGRQRPFGASLIPALHTMSVLFTLSLLAQKLEDVLRPWWSLPPGTLGLAAVAVLYWPYVALSIKRWSGAGWGRVVGRMVLLAVGTSVIDGLVYAATLRLAILTLGRGSQ